MKKSYSEVLKESFNKKPASINFEITKEDIGEFCKLFLKDLVNESKVIKESLTFPEHLEMYKKVSEMSEDEMISLVFFEGEVLTEEKIQALKSKIAKAASLGFAAIAGGIGVITTGSGATAVATGKIMSKTADPFAKQVGKTMMKPGYTAIATGIGISVATIAYFLYKRLNDPCRQKCKSDKNKQLCYYQCAENAAKKVLMNLKSELGKCGKTKNPDKCKKKITKEIKKWQVKVEGMHKKVIKYKTQSMS